MKEVYRSFEGKLNLDNQSGYIIYELKDFYQIEFLSIEKISDDSGSIRLRKHIFSEEDFSNLEKITKLETYIESGCADYGQCQYKGKWYSVPVIRKIQFERHDGNWKKYVY